MNELKLRFDKKIVVVCLLFFVLLGSNSFAKVYECHYGPFKDNNGMMRTDLFPFSKVEINHFFKKITFYQRKPFPSLKHDGIKIDTLKFYKKNKSNYKTEKFKQRKMTNDEKKMLQNPTEYYWEEVKDYYLEIWFPIDYRDRNPFMIDIVTSIRPNKWFETYTCYIPRN